MADLFGMIEEVCTVDLLVPLWKQESLRKFVALDRYFQLEKHDLHPYSLLPVLWLTAYLLAGFMHMPWMFAVVTPWFFHLFGIHFSFPMTIPFKIHPLTLSKFLLSLANETKTLVIFLSSCVLHCPWDNLIHHHSTNLGLAIVPSFRCRVLGYLMISLLWLPKLGFQPEYLRQVCQIQVYIFSSW